MVNILMLSLMLVFAEVRSYSLVTRCREPESLNISTLLDAGKQLTLRNVPKSFVEKRTHIKRQDITCPTRSEILEAGRFQTELCPTYSETDVDINRIPQKIVQRRCMCTECLSVLDSSMTGRAFSRCVPMFQYQMVLRRVGCTDGVYEYRPVMEPFVVGCSCKLFF